MQNNDERIFETVGPFKQFFTGLLNSFFILILGICIYFSFLKPYNFKNYSSSLAEKHESYEVLLNLGRESKMLKGNKANTEVYSQTNYYEFFLGTILKTDYEASSYNLNSDPDGYKNAQHKFEEFNIIKIENNIIEDDFLGYFYTSFCIGRLNRENQPLISCSSIEASSYFFQTILSVSDSQKGGKFFDYINDQSYPHLKPTIRRQLFDYNVNKIPMSENILIDSEFFSYFCEIFDCASSLLLNDKEYGANFDAFNNAVKVVESKEKISIFSSYGISAFLVLVLPLVFNKKRANLGQITSKTSFLNDDEKLPIGSIIGSILLSLVESSFVVFVFCYFGDGNILRSALFTIGNFSFKISYIVIISLIYILANIIVLLIDKENRSIANLICRTYSVREIKKSGNNRLCDID